MCRCAGEVGLFAALFTDLNPIEEFFAELKNFIKRYWNYFGKGTDQGFDVFLEWCIDIVGAREDSARGHYQHAGLSVEDLND